MKFRELFCGVAVICFIMTVSSTVIAAEKPLSIGEAWCFTNYNNEQIAAAISKVEKARQELNNIKVEQILNPSVLKLKEAEFALANAEINLDIVKRQELLELAEKYFNVLLKQERLLVLQQTLGIVKRNFQNAVAQQKRGLLANIDLMDFQRQLIKAEVNSTVAKNELKLAKAAFFILPGLADKKECSLSRLPEPSDKPVLVTNNSEILMHQPVIRQLTNDIELLELQLEFAKSMNIPPAQVILLEKQHDEAKHKLQISCQEQEIEILRLKMDILNDFEKIKSFNADLTYATENYGAVSLLYKKGLGTAKEINEALNNKTMAELAKLDGIINYAVAVQKYDAFCKVQKLL